MGKHGNGGGTTPQGWHGGQRCFPVAGTRRRVGERRVLLQQEEPRGGKLASLPPVVRGRRAYDGRHLVGLVGSLPLQGYARVQVLADAPVATVGLEAKAEIGRAPYVRVFVRFGF